MEALDPQMKRWLQYAPAEFRPPCGACLNPLRPQPFPVDLAYMLVRQEFGISRDDLVSKRRYDQLVRARAFFVWLLRTLGQQYSYPQIGAMLGGRDHSTIINLHRKAIVLRLQVPAFNAACRRIGLRWKAQGALPDASSSRH